MIRYAGSWKPVGFVVSIPLAQADVVKVARVKTAAAKVGISSSFFYVVIPSDAPNPEGWVVSVDSGALKVEPPAHQPAQGPDPASSVTVQLVLPRGVAVSDRL